MALVLTSAPAVEPLSLIEAKAQLRVTDAAEDAMISTLIIAARRRVEAAAGLALLAQGWSLYLDRWPGPEIALPLHPVTAVSDIFVYGEDDVGASIDAAHYYVDTGSRPARVVLRGGRIWPLPGRRANGIEVAFTAGFGAAAAAVPEDLRQAALQLVAHWFEHRGDEAALRGTPLGFDAAVAHYRRARL